MQDVVRAAIEEYGLILPGETVVVGLSGGPDSVALTHALLTLAPQMDFKLCAAHLNHGIREAAAEDERFVVEMCDFYGLPLYREKADVPALAKARGQTLEQAGREERYAFFRRAKAHFAAQKVAVAHHMDDQAESILLHLTRGSGLTGLVGMLPLREDIIRPLLFLRRFEVEEYLNREGLAWCVDATNLETGGTRNRLRLELIPYVEEHINPAFVDTLCSMGELLLRDERYLQTQARDLLTRARRAEGYDRKLLRAQPLPILTRALRLAFADAGGADMERVHVEQLVSLLHARTGARIQLPGMEAWISYNDICFGKPAPIPVFCVPFVPNGVTQTPLGRFVATPAERPTSFGVDRNVAYLDADKLAGAVVRSRQSGDRIFPIGAPGRKKLKEYFIDRKVPREKRALPLLCLGDDVLFLPGFCAGDAARLTEETARVLRVTYEVDQHQPDQQEEKRG